jgi:hypothetical protein
MNMCDARRTIRGGGEIGKGSMCISEQYRYHRRQPVRYVFCVDSSTHCWTSHLPRRSITAYGSKTVNEEHKQGTGQYGNV